MKADKELEVRCFCARAPLLALCGRDTKTGDPYVHVKSARKDRINAEVLVTSGSARVRCRECLRWHTIRIRRVNVEHKPEELPASLDIS